MVSYKKEDRLLNLVINVVLGLATIFAIYPLWYVLIASFSNPQNIATGKVLLFPVGFNASAYTKLFSDMRIWVGYKNSIFYTVVGTAISLALTLPCAYALSRPRLPGRKILSFFFVFTMYFSGGLVPSYLLLNSLKMLNTVWAVLLPGAVSSFNLIVARSFFESNIPEPLYESATIDGASYIRFFFSFVIPLSKAVIAVLMLFYGLVQWNAYFAPMVYLQSRDLQPLQVVIAGITATLDASVSETTSGAELMRIIEERQLIKYSIVIVSALPMFFVYPLVYRHFQKGIMIGAIKG